VRPLICICRSCAALISCARAAASGEGSAGSAGAGDGPNPAIVAVRSGLFRAVREVIFRLPEGGRDMLVPRLKASTCTDGGW